MFFPDTYVDIPVLFTHFTQVHSGAKRRLSANSVMFLKNFSRLSKKHEGFENISFNLSNLSNGNTELIFLRTISILRFQPVKDVVPVRPPWPCDGPPPGVEPVASPVHRVRRQLRLQAHPPVEAVQRAALALQGLLGLAGGGEEVASVELRDAMI